MKRQQSDLLYMYLNKEGYDVEVAYDGGAGLQQAMAQASSGNTAQLAEMIRQVMQSPQGAALVRNIGTSFLK